jgi:hypothetical protein
MLVYDAEDEPIVEHIFSLPGVFVQVLILSLFFLLVLYLIRKNKSYFLEVRKG